MFSCNSNFEVLGPESISVVRETKPNYLMVNSTAIAQCEYDLSYLFIQTRM